MDRSAVFHGLANLHQVSGEKKYLKALDACGRQPAYGPGPLVTHADSPESGIMRLWETFEGLGLGTAVVIDPQRVVKMESHTDAAGQTQALCLARTDQNGHIRWFPGFGWEGQGDITSAERWDGELKEFAAKFFQSPMADHSKDATFKVHSLGVPAAATPVSAP